MQFAPFTHEVHACRALLSERGAAATRDEVASLSIRRPMVVGSPRALGSRTGIEILEALADLAPMPFDRVREHPELAEADAGAELARAGGIDGFVSVGGGSAVDLAKGIALSLVLGRSIEEFATNSASPQPLLHDLVLAPIIAVPNTASGAEVTPGMGLRDRRGHKLILRHAGAVSRSVVLDPRANLETPARVLMPSGMNAVAHCLEALYSLKRDPISDALALGGLRLLHRGHWRLLGEDGVEARSAILSGAFLAGRAIVNARTGVHHAVCHVLGAHGLSHGLANAILLPHALRFNAMAGHLLEPAAQLLGLTGTGEDAAFALAEAVDALCRAGGMPRRLSDVGVQQADLHGLASEAMAEPGLAFNPRQPLSVDDISALLASAS